MTLSLVVAASLLFIACAPKPVPPSSPVPLAPPIAVHTIEIKIFAFNPATLTIRKGETVTWINKDTMNHTVTSARNFDSGTIAPGAQWSYTFPKTGTFSYICTIHANMKGTVIVTNGEVTPPPLPPQPPAPPKWSADGIITPGEYAKSKTLPNYEIHWTTDEKHIFIAMKAKTKRWVAIAFEPETKMKNGDIVLGFVQGGKTEIYDTFSIDERGPHPPDTQLGGKNDIIEFGGKEDGEYTIIEFKRALDTGDIYDKELTKGVNRIMWAYSDADRLTAKHSERGYGEIELEHGRAETAP